MKMASQVLFWLGILAIPLAWLVWYMGPEIEVGRQVIGDIANSVWPVTLLVLSYVLERRA
jgi:1,4-dihydroxy-2-naphthoate octaprenyltransferase